MMPILSMLYGARKLMLICFAGVFSVLLVLLAVKPDKYQANMSFLVRNERAESLVSADPAKNETQQSDVTEDRINSQVELLGSTEILKSVVVDTDLETEFLNRARDNRSAAIEKATRSLSKHLEIAGVRKSSIINVTYTSSNRDQAKSVLDSLSKEYLAQYTRLHDVGGASEFYKDRGQALEKELLAAEDERASLFTRNSYLLLPTGEQLGLQTAVDLQKSRNDVAASLAETESRLDQVKQEQKRTQERVATQTKTSFNPYTVEQLNTKLAELQNQKTELQTKFVDGDPLLLQKEKEIADTRLAFQDAGKIHSTDTTNDINPIRQALDGEANRLYQARAGLNSRLTELDRQLSEQRALLSDLERSEIEMDRVDRRVKLLQESVGLYRSKALAASAAEALDPNQFQNVVEATHPTVPVLPAPSSFNLVTAFLLSVFLSLGAGLASQWSTRETPLQRRTVGSNRSGVAIVVLLAVFLAPFSMRGQSPVAQIPAHNLPAAQSYRLQPGDSFAVLYRITPEYNQTVTVPPDGVVNLQLLPPLEVGGLTLAQATELITTAAAKRLRNPDLSIDLKDYERPHFTVLGDVQKPGIYDLRGHLSVQDGLAMAGGFTLIARHTKILLIHRVNDETGETHLIDFRALMNTSQKSGIELRRLQPGDLIIVPTSKLGKIERYVKLANTGVYYNPAGNK